MAGRLTGALRQTTDIHHSLLLIPLCANSGLIEELLLLAALSL